MQKLLKIGHRGAKGHVAENTAESFHKAFELGCEGIELDVHLSKDGHVIVIHDETVDRTTNGKGFVKDMTFSDIKNLQTQSGLKIPTLTEVLNAVKPGKLINIELKSADATSPTAKIIEEFVLEEKYDYDNFIISSFNWETLKILRQLNSAIPIGVLTSTDLSLAIAFADFIAAESIHPYFHLLTSENILLMQKKHLKVFTWTVNERSDIEKMKSFNVDGIISDYPERI